VRAFSILLVTLLLGCNRGTPCNDHAECKKGTTCHCDDGGRIVRIERDGKVDKLKYKLDDAGRVIVIETDFGNNGSVDRQQEYGYDTEGRRVSYQGWLEKCGGEKFRWSCVYEEPCPAPYLKCSTCRKKYETEKRNGTIVPCAGSEKVDTD
jgi:hypothetical protein